MHSGPFFPLFPSFDCHGGSIEHIVGHIEVIKPMRQYEHCEAKQAPALDYQFQTL